jgi:serine protease Do
VKAADPWLEVAVLQIDADNLTPIALGDAKTLKKGQLAIALGNPLATARDGEPSAAWAMIANLGRQAPANAQSGARAGRETLHHYGTLIQLDTRSMLGTSGGAVVNLAGELVGLTTTLTSLPRQDREAGFAIPIDDDFKTALDTLKAGRLPEYGFLGIAPQSLSLPDRQAGRLGALVEDVVPGTPAAMSGIKPGDFITKVNDTPVRDDLHLIRLVSALPAESEVRVGVKRELSAQNAKSVSVVLSKKFQESARESFAEIKAAPWRGMRVEYATAAPAFRDSIRHLDPLGCVAVLEVERDSAAWKAGLRAGQFITHVDDARVLTPKQFYAAVEERQEEEEVSLRVTTSADGELVRRVAGSG